MKKPLKMEEKESIDKIRNSGGYAEIGTPEDGAILEMVNIGEKLLVIKERAIYEYILADSIDPERTNINLPNSIQKIVMNQGAESQLVSKSFLTAKSLFQSNFLEDSININKLINLSVEITQELIELESELNDFIKQEKTVSEEYETRKKERKSFAIPSVLNLETQCKTIFQKADHIEQILMETIIVFFSNDGLKKQSHFPKFYEIIKIKYGENDSFCNFINNSLYFMKLVRELRNALDHRLEYVSVKNFELKSDSNIISPTIELNHKEVKLERLSLSYFLPIVLDNMLLITELVYVYLAEKFLKKNALAYQIKEIPLEKRRYKHMRFSFWSPIGTDGYYLQ
jgi:hypothetical protein